MTLRALALSALALLAACDEEQAAAPPSPALMTAEAVGHYCQMDVLEHDGPKAQIFVEGLSAPLWFGQVRDAIAFLRLPEETGRAAAFYVSDMAKAPSWNAPGADNWIDGRSAVFVIGARLSGGMGAPEAVPFATQAQAEAWRAANGGEIVGLDGIPDAYVLAPVEIASSASEPDEATR